MKTQSHVANIATEIITSEDGKNTYEIIKKIDANDFKGGKGLFICLYPTKNKENLYCDDSTTLYLIERAFELGFSEIHVCNIFSTVTSGRMSAKGLKPDKANLDYLKSVFKRKDFGEYTTVIAWGGSLEGSAATNESKKEILQSFYAAHPKGKLYQMMCPEKAIFSETLHPLFLGLRCKGAKLELIEYKDSKYLNATESKNG